jgi:hypothetical protein
MFKEGKDLEGGYMGLLLLVIGLVVIIIFIVRTDLITGGDKNIIETGKDAIDKANETKRTLENKYKFDPDQQERDIDNLN